MELISMVVVDWEEYNEKMKSRMGKMRKSGWMGINSYVGIRSSLLHSRMTRGNNYVLYV
jgi:hypothetical protein